MSWHIFIESLIGGAPSVGEAAGAAGGGMLEAGARAFGTLIEGIFGAGHGAAATESIFARTGAAAEHLLNTYVNVKLSGIDELFKGSTEPGGVFHSGIEDRDTVKAAIKGHSLLREQLEKNSSNKAVAEALEAYSASGAKLPDDQVIQKAYRALSMVYHPDRKETGNEDLFKRVKEAYEGIHEKPELRQTYNRAVEEHPKEIEGLFNELKNNLWGKFNDAVKETERLMIAGPGGSSSELKGATKWAAELTTAKKTGLVFAVVGAITVGAYIGAKIMDKKKKARLHTELGTEPFQKREVERSATPAAGLG